MKSKSKKRGLSDALHAKKAKGVVKKVNPFELHESREKFDIINRRRNHSLGVPTKSRQIAIDRRKETLGKEFDIKNKSNVFKDSRKAGFRVKESIYNLNDSEVLTHHGQTLSEIQRFDDFDHEEDDEMSDDELRLDSKFTEAAHFGNFEAEDGMKDRKTVIDELIAESKKRKKEKAREQEKMLNMTDKLDSEWRELLPVMNKLTKNEDNDRQPDDYDKLVKEMIFSPRAEPTEKLKNEEEVARLEKEKLMKLERERIARMEAAEEEESGEKKIKHKSADDLDDGYFMVAEEENDEGTLAYDINPEEEEEENDEKDEEMNDDEEEQEELGDEECENEEDDEESDVDSLNDLKPESESDEDADENENESEEEEDEDENSENESEEEEIAAPSSKVLKISDDPKTPAPKVEKPQEKETKHSEILNSIPFTIAMPLCFEHLEELLGDYPISVQATIVDRIIKTNHPKLMHTNKAKMLQLFAYLLQLLNDKFSSENLSKGFKLLKCLIPHLYDIVHMSPAEASNCFLEVVKEKYEEFKKNPKNFPQLDTIIFFQILGKIFPTSDFKHPVVTPCYVFIHHIFSQARVKSRSDIARGLYLATLVLDYQELSKKFLPSILNFLSGICYLGSDRSLTLNDKPIPPFKRGEPILLIQDKISNFDTESKLKSEDFLDSEIDDEFRVNALNLNVQLIRDYIQLYKDHVGIHYLIDAQMKYLKFVKQQTNLPKSLKSLIKNILTEFETIKSSKMFLYPKPDKKVTPMLRQLEPQFETVLSDRRSMYAEARGGGRQEEKKLQHMVKREFKSAKRELRRDNEFLSKMKFKRRQDQDRERQAKVKRIFDQASIQQSEFNKMSKAKARRAKF